MFHHPYSHLILTVSAAMATAASGVQTSIQTLRLREGWNAVHLSVTPAADIAGVFAGTPVEIVSTWYPEKNKVLSLQDPAAEPWKSPEWRTWQAAGRAGDILNNLYALESGRAYLIKARVAVDVPVTGVIEMNRLQWNPQSFNLTGLPADPAAPATLAGFFASSPAHQPLRVFKLNANKWQAVPSTAAIEPDTAYWVWCGAGSEYQGPLDVRVSDPPRLNSAEDSITIGLLSTTGTALPVRITASGTLPLTAVTRERLTAATPADITAAPLTFSANPVDPGLYRIALAAGAAPPAGADSLLEFRAAGVRLIVPVRTAP